MFNAQKAFESAMEFAAIGSSAESPVTIAVIGEWYYGDYYLTFFFIQKSLVYATTNHKVGR